MPLWSMAVKALQAQFLCNRKEVITFEDHLYDGGFFSWLLEARAASKTLRCRIHPIALNSDVCGTVGGQKTLHKLGGLLG